MGKVPLPDMDARSEVLKDELTDIWNNSKSQRSRKGDMGETFVKSAIKQSFFEKGYKLGEEGNGTFRVYKRVKAQDEKGRGGIDFNVGFTDSSGNSDEFFAEVKNWADYGISQNTYESEIRSRFDKVDSSNSKKRALAIPEHQTRNQHIKNKCPKDNITTLPIDQQLDGSTLGNDEVKPTFKNFKKNVDDYIDDFVPDAEGISEEGILGDLIQGKDYGVIAKKWGVSERTIQNYASDFRGEGYDVPRQGRKKFKTISLVRYEMVW